MAVKEYQWQKATPSQLKHCLSWCKKILQLSDWKIALMTHKHRPSCYEGGEDDVCGWVLPDSTRLRAKMWVPIENNKKENTNPYASLIHEMIHVLEAHLVAEYNERLVRIIEPYLYEKYCRENKLKIADERKSE